MLRMICGSEVISPVVESVMVERLGWSFARGWRPAAVLRFWWYLLGLFLYSASSFFLLLREFIVDLTE